MAYCLFRMHTIACFVHIFLEHIERAIPYVAHCLQCTSSHYIYIVSTSFSNTANGQYHTIPYCIAQGMKHPIPQKQKTKKIRSKHTTRSSCPSYPQAGLLDEQVRLLGGLDRSLQLHNAAQAAAFKPSQRQLQILPNTKHTTKTLVSCWQAVPGNKTKQNKTKCTTPTPLIPHQYESGKKGYQYYH